MGCAQSRVENEEAVARCKDRRQLMKEAVASRSAFASAHSSYVISLKNTGAAIMDFACPTPSFLPPPPTPNTSTSATTDATSATTTVTARSPPPHPLSPINATNSPFPPPPPPLPPDSPPSPLLPRSSTLPPRLNPNPSTNPDRQHPHVTPPPPPDSKGSSTWDYFFSLEDTMPVPTLVEEGEPAAAAAAEDGVGKDEVEEDKAGEAGMLRHASSAGEADVKTAAAEREVSKKAEVSSGNGPSLAQVLVKLDDHFLKASEAALEVSKLLEATRMHYHSNFADSRGHIDHSARVMRVITWNRSFKGMPNDDERDDFDSEKWETHASVLDKLLAWEKKLYDEVKTGELMKIEYQRKVALLNRQKKRGANYETLEKTKAAVSHLHTRYIVDMQSMDSTVSEIQHLRDDQLYPKLAELVDGMAKMWESMHAHHEIQLGAVTDLRGVDISCTPKETSEEHYRKADQLRCVASDWHSQFEKLVNYQRDYIHALNGWLKLNLIPIESSLKEKVSSPPRVNQPPVQALLHAWNDQLEKLPDELAKSCIKSFSAVINTIMLNQQEELKQREKCEDLKKEYFKKERAFSDWYHKYSTRKMGTEDGGRDQDESSHAKDPISEKQFVIESLNKRVEEEEEVYRKLCKQVREKSVSSLKMHLPELFRAMSEFSLECSHMYKNLLAITQAQNQNHAA